MAQFWAPLRPADAEHLMQYAGAFQGKLNAVQVTAWIFISAFVVVASISLFSRRIVIVRPAALDFVLCPSCKNAVAKTPGVPTKSRYLSRPLGRSASEAKIW